MISVICIGYSMRRASACDIQDVEPQARHPVYHMRRESHRITYLFHGSIQFERFMAVEFYGIVVFHIHTVSLTPELWLTFSLLVSSRNPDTFSTT